MADAPVRALTCPRFKATDVEYDFLQLLLAQVNKTKCKKAKKGKKGKCLRYKAVVVNEEFDFETPVNDEGDQGLTGRGPQRASDHARRDPGQAEGRNQDAQPEPGDVPDAASGRGRRRASRST